VHQVGYNKLIDIMMHGQRNVKIGKEVFQTDFTVLTLNLPERIQEIFHGVMRGSHSLLLLRIVYNTIQKCCSAVSVHIKNMSL
jgi:hypothetical protein